MLIREVLSVKSGMEVISVAPETSAAEAVARMVEHDIGSLAVMKAGAMVGFVTERNILRGVHARACTLTDIEVAQLMERAPLVATPDDSADYAREAMTKSHTSHLVVLDDGKLFGILSFHDLARAYLKDVNFENALLKRYIKNWPE